MKCFCQKVLPTSNKLRLLHLLHLHLLRHHVRTAPRHVRHVRWRHMAQLPLLWVGRRQLHGVRFHAPWIQVGHLGQFLQKVIEPQTSRSTRSPSSRGLEVWSSMAPRLGSSVQARGIGGAVWGAGAKGPPGAKQYTQEGQIAKEQVVPSERMVIQGHATIASRIGETQA